MAVDGKLQQVRQYFERKGIQLDSDWLNGCVEFFIDENPSISISQLCQQAEEQWELSDLSDSGIKCLPDSIFTNKAIQTINGTFPLQIQFLIDISESPFDQLQRLQNKETEVANEQPEFKQKYEKSKKKRMLKLDLSDGFRTVSALEYTPISFLNTQLAPGLKVIVTGPLRCVNHILFLEAKNIRILGGEVTTLAIESAYENVLRKILGQPINPNPITNYQESTIAGYETATTTIRADNIPSIPMTARSNTAIQSSSRRNIDTFDDFPDDDALLAIDIEQITANAVTPTKTSTTLQNQNDIPLHRQSTLLFDDFDDDFLNIDEPINSSATSPPLQASKQCDNINIESSTLETHTIRQLSAVEPTIYADNYRFKIRGLNLVTIKQVNECSAENRKRRKYFIIKARIEKIVRPARVSQMKWTLSVLLADQFSENVTLSVSFSNEVLEKLAGGISGRELHEMYNMRSERPQFQSELDAILRNLGEKLEEMYLFMKIDFDDSNSDLPVVVELINSAPVLDRKLHEKIEYESI